MYVHTFFDTEVVDRNKLYLIQYIFSYKVQYYEAASVEKF